MDLSIIIVNYNVKYFLEQCLFSVENAAKGLAVEIIVIDNKSTDNSLAYLQPSFPEIRFIANTENHGFAQACNQGLKEATGKYILFLNPDTILPENCLQKSIAFLEARPQAGALGIRMIDGSGHFLRESKRSFPSPLTSFYKLSGLAAAFPRSPVFAKYHLGHLDESKDQEVDVLAGAFMLIKKTVLDKIGSFDETFFMYGEDVDLSYRIQKAGYFNLFIHIAIWVRASLSALAAFIRRIGLPLMDATLILFSFLLVKVLWNDYVKTGTLYETRILRMAFPSFTILYLVAAYYAGLYDRWYKTSELIRSTLIATVVLLAGYALLPESLRFSRGIVLFGAMLAFILIALLRWILVRTAVLSDGNEKELHANTLIIGTEEEYRQCVSILQDAGAEQKIIGRIAVDPSDNKAIGKWPALDNVNRSIPLREIIFCQGYLSFGEIVDFLPRLKTSARLMIHAAGSRSIVGSKSGKSAGEFVAGEKGLMLADPYTRRLKRLLDITVAVAGIVTFPIQLFLIKKPGGFLLNCINVIIGRKTWIGYGKSLPALPKLRPGVLASNGLPVNSKQILPEESLQMMDYWYARDYEVSRDIKLIRSGYSQLGD